MKKLTKKGQTEDFLADLIPSAIIIIIGVLVLSNMHSVNNSLAKGKEIAIKQALILEEKNIAYYLPHKIDVDGKKISLQELISLTYNNPQYQGILGTSLEREGLAQYDVPPEQSGETTVQIKPEYVASSPTECLNLVIKYPGDSKPLIIGDKCVGIEQNFYLPTFDGQILEIKSIVGTKG